ncbi:MAG: siphovirus ReqiPepy6 Gp37-like family protein [Oscillospiraceae bacterium]|nr:siphovirus ReqiPepy6 Gp37-like family protein [Oscillospiraceae bacterium]
MILYVWKFDGEKYQKIGIIDNATSIIWVRRFQNAGEFEIYIHATKNLFELFMQEELLITRHDVPESAMIPERIELTTDSENGNYLIISGKSAESILGRRIIQRMSTYSGTVEVCMRYFVGICLVTPHNGNRRRIKQVKFTDLHNYPETINKQITGKNLLEAISDICATYGYGFKLSFTGENFIFDVYKGTDRSLHQSENKFVIFSPEFDNIGETSYIYDKSGYYNAVTIAGEGEGKDRKIYNVWSSSSSIEEISGLSLREVWIDARNTSSNAESEELSNEEYEKILKQQAVEELERCKSTIEFSGEVLDTGLYKFGIDYELGDTVSIVNSFGISGTAIVKEITEVEDETGYKLTPTFSDWRLD